MAVDVETWIDIECPRSVVAAYVSNPDNATEWYVNIKSVDWETPPPAVVGSRVAFVASFLGRRIAYTYQVRHIVPDERFVMSSLRNEGEPSGFGKMAAPVMAAAMRRANQKDLARLKRILEARK